VSFRELASEWTQLVDARFDRRFRARREFVVRQRSRLRPGAGLV
jgi:hypothetical protein